MKNFQDEELIHVRCNNKVEYIKFKILEQYSNKLTHGIMLRHGGVSRGVYKSLNVRTLGNDKYENVDENLNRICSSLNISKEDVFKAKQDHTDNILIVNNNNKKEYKFSDLSKDAIDGYITNKKNINTLVTTADCNPIIIYDHTNNVVANIHSGWKGTIKKISLKAVNIMHEKFNSKYEDLIVCIGPSIRKCCFTSKEKIFKEKFIKVWPNEDDYIITDKNGEFHIDLIYVIVNDLLKLGIKKDNIKIADICTCCNEDDFFSYRKATQRKDIDYATFATVAGLK